MPILVFLEHHDGEIQKGSLGVLAQRGRARRGRRRRRCSSAAASRALAGEAGRYGAANVSWPRTQSSSRRCRSPASTCSRASCATAATTPCCFANSVLAADVAAGLAARLEAGLNWDLVDLELRDGELVGKQPMLAGLGARRRRLALDAAPRALPCRLVRRGAGRGRRAAGRGARRSTLADHSRPARVVDQELEQASGPSIEDADVIVAGGIGLGAPEHFTLAEQLAACARRRGRRDARRRLRRLVSARGADRADGQDRLAEALRRARHLRRDAAQGGHAELEDDRRDQQGRERADLRVQRPRRRRRRARRRPQLIELVRSASAAGRA